MRLSELFVHQQGKNEGATCLLDGSDFVLDEAGYENGNWVGTTVFADVSEDRVIYQEKIFGPVLCYMTVDTLEQAIVLVNRNPYGNATSILSTEIYMPMVNKQCAFILKQKRLLRAGLKMIFPLGPI
jgi:acyl-CoA reductase-like NAD-dependent aldehyde dehydrogenase